MAQAHSDAPPPYSATMNHASGSNTSSSGHLQPTRSSIPTQARRSMEDEHRELPPGWIRRFDEESQHQFFVDTEAKPPRSIWHHPYDDDQYLRSLPTEQRERIEAHYAAPTSHLDEDTDDDEHHQQHSRGKAPTSSQPEKKSLGQKMKDKLTGTTHEQREQERRERDEAEQRAYERHQKLRQAMAKAVQTGEPQLIGKDKQGRDLYLEPPQAGQGWGASGTYHQDPNARYVRPDYGYSRPVGRGYGGGMSPYGYGIGMNPYMLGMGGLGLGMGLGYGLGGLGYGGGFGGGGFGDGGGFGGGGDFGGGMGGGDMGGGGM